MGAPGRVAPKHAAERSAGGTRRGLGLALIATALLRLPAFQWRVLSDDEAIYDAMGGELARGGVMYRDTVDHKPPGLAYTYAACRRLAGPGEGSPARTMACVHGVGLLAACGTVLLLFALGRRLLGEGAAVWSAALYGVVSAAKPPFDALAVNGELLMNLPLALAALCAASATRLRGGARAVLDVCAGALCATGALYKYQALTLVLALPLLAFEEAKPPAARALSLAARGASWLIGLLAPLAAVALYFQHRGALDDALFWGVGFNRAYLAQGPGLLWSAKRLGMQLAGVVVPGIALYGAGLRTLLSLAGAGGRADVVAGRAFLAGWATLSLAAVGLGGRFFGHYFVQAELPLALLAAAAMQRNFQRAPLRSMALLSLPAIAFGAVAAQPALSRRVWNAGDPDFESVGRAAAAITGPDQRIWVWGNVPQIYHFADRLPGARFVFCNYMTGLSPATPSEHEETTDPRRDRVPGALAMAVADIEVRRPALILDTAEHDVKHYGRFPIRDFPPLAEHLSRHYRRGETVASVVFYRRVD